MHTKIALVTGSCGLVGSEAVNFFIKKGFFVIGIDNNLRQFFFGKNGSTTWLKKKLINKHKKKYKHFSTDIRNYSKLEFIFKKYKKKNKNYYSFSGSTIARLGCFQAFC